MLRRLGYALAILGAVIATGTVGYMLIGRWTFFDSLYMTVITVGTTGFREVRPLSDAGRWLTMFLIIAGFGAIIFSIGTIIEFMVEGHFSGIVEGRRMSKRIREMSGHHVVAGLGRVGLVVASQFADEGVPFVVIDASEASLTEAKEHDWPYVEGDATEEEILVEAGLRRAKSLVTALDTDAANLFVTLTARGMNPDLFIIARSTTPSAEAKLLRAGANRVITPTDIGGRRMAALVLQPVVSDYLDVVMRGDALELKLEEIELAAGDPYVGRSIKEAHIRSETGAYILAVRAANGTLNTNPSPDTVLSDGDRVVAMGTEEQLALLAGKACSSPDECRAPGL